MSIAIITTQEVEERLRNGEKLNLIDVREVDEVAQGKIAGIQHIALGTLPERTHELDRNKEYIMVCRSGARSERACEFLQAQGFNVKNMVGGMLAWQGEVV